MKQHAMGMNKANFISVSDGAININSFNRMFHDFIKTIDKPVDAGRIEFCMRGEDVVFIYKVDEDEIDKKDGK